VQNAITFKARWEEEFLKVPCMCISICLYDVNDVRAKWMQCTKFDMLYAQPRVYENKKSGAHKSACFLCGDKTQGTHHECNM